MDGRATLEVSNLAHSLTIDIPGPSELKCEICHSEFEDSKSLRDHLMKELGIQPELVSFLDIDLQINSDEDVSPLTDCSEHQFFQVRCDKCGKICKTERGLNQHIGKAHPKGKRHSICKICGKAFRHKYTLRFHVKQVHDQATRVACKLCGALLYNKYRLPEHLRKEHSVEY